MVSDLCLIQQRREMEKVTTTEWHKLRVLDNEYPKQAGQSILQELPAQVYNT